MSSSIDSIPLLQSALLLEHLSLASRHVSHDRCRSPPPRHRRLPVEKHHPRDPVFSISRMVRVSDFPDQFYLRRAAKRKQKRKPHARPRKIRPFPGKLQAQSAAGYVRCPRVKRHEFVFASVPPDAAGALPMHCTTIGSSAGTRARKYFRLCMSDTLAGAAMRSAGTSTLPPRCARVRFSTPARNPYLSPSTTATTSTVSSLRSATALPLIVGASISIVPPSYSGPLKKTTPQVSQRPPLDYRHVYGEVARAHPREKRVPCRPVQRPVVCWSDLPCHLLPLRAFIPYSIVRPLALFNPSQ